MIDLEFARRHLSTKLDDETLAEKLEAAEAAVRAYTHNRFPCGLPPDVQMGIVSMVAWSLKTADKQGIASETLSRHSVTYVQLGEDSVMGFPKGIMAFCKPYRRCRT